ncbi:MAG: carbon-nitrogen hydrolase family protein [Marinoscillum sp.]|uniref:carbon-nitrogen hydrolase family protein n=1 Tax=Marinoscillum sp. TaxID=2024838 RepID=UPI0032FB18E5
MGQSEILKVAIAQISPKWLHREATLQKVIDCVREAAGKGAGLVVFGEALVPGYPFWVEKTDGAVFESPVQQEIFAHYVNEAVCIERGDLDVLCATALESKIAIYLGIIEQPRDRGRSLYCTLVYIDQQGVIQSTHRKVMPTYEERLVWANGDGNGLVTHSLSPFTVGGLNCWENWLPLARATLYAQGEDLHVSVWPGNDRNTRDLIPMIAKESRSYVIAACGLFSDKDITDDLPQSPLMKERIKGTLANGGSCVAAPDGSWLLEPVINQEGIFYADIDHQKVRAARLSLDVSGHYSRPDIFQLEVNQQRATILKKPQKNP